MNKFGVYYVIKSPKNREEVVEFTKAVSLTLLERMTVS